MSKTASRQHKTLRGILVLAAVFATPGALAASACPEALHPLLLSGGDAGNVDFQAQFWIEAAPLEAGFGARPQRLGPNREQTARLLDLLKVADGDEALLESIWSSSRALLPGQRFDDVLAVTDTALHRKITPREVLDDLKRFTDRIVLRAQPSTHLQAPPEAELAFVDRWMIYLRAAQRDMEAEAVISEVNGVQALMPWSSHRQTLSVWLLGNGDPLPLARSLTELRQGLTRQRTAMGLVARDPLDSNLLFQELLDLYGLGLRLKLNVDGLIRAYKRLDALHGPEIEDVLKALDQEAEAFEHLEAETQVQI
jgi:hypothetical protein